MSLSALIAVWIFSVASEKFAQVRMNCCASVLQMSTEE